MARTTFPVEVLTPEGKAWEGEVEMISTRTSLGSVGILAHHAPLMAMLEPTELKLYESDSEQAPAGAPPALGRGEGSLQGVDTPGLRMAEDGIRREASTAPRSRRASTRRAAGWRRPRRAARRSPAAAAT